jgi:hypothetical protein
VLDTKRQADTSNEIETEVTPEMVRAGADAYAEFDERFFGVEDVLPDIYRAMAAAKKAR